MRRKNLAVLLPLKNVEPEKCNKIVFDIETINWVTPYSVGMYDGENMITFDGFDCIKEFIDYYLVRKYRNSVAFAHNGGKFDFSFILQELVQKKYMRKYIIRPMRAGSRIIQISISTKKKRIVKGKEVIVIGDTWTLRDSFAMLGFSLKKLTKSFDVKDKKGEFDHEKINRSNWKKLMPEWKPYLINDCKGLYQVLDKWESYLIKTYGISLRKSITIAQLSMQIYRTKYLKMPLVNYKSQEKEIRKSYYGGRTEVFRMYGENLNYYDVNSLYPYVMYTKSMPVDLPIKSRRIKVSDCAIAYAEIDCPSTIKYPVLPYRIDKGKGKLIFPTGKWKGWYCTPELRKAKQIGYNIKIIRGYKFMARNIFKKYISDLYKIKQKSKKNSVEYMCSKLLMNSLYGKFGQRREKESLIIFPDSPLGLEPIDFFEDLPVYIRKSESDATHILPAISSFIACYSRLEMYNYMEKAVNSGKKIYYMDTDSLVTNAKFKESEDLGGMEREYKIKNGIFLMPKMYAIKLSNGKEEIKCKGFPKGTFKYNMFKKCIETGDYSQFNYNKKKFASPFESMRRNKKFVSMINLTRRVISRYDKRIVLNNFDTDPKEVLNETV